ncbi:MAG: T9SS type A sorting domain-containing protein [Chlorobi bacterium]|nr:T9SS type A sorting domain-containing protein [Chlorobiota bacterium]
MFPYVLQKQSGGANFVVASTDYEYDRDTSAAVTITQPQPSVGTLGFVTGNYVSYSVWVDSVDGHTNLFGVKRLDPIGDVNDDENNRNGYRLYQNYPNPFNPTTTIEYSIPFVGNANFAYPTVTLKIYDILGSEITTLVNEKQHTGNYSIRFNATNLSSGIYFYSLQIGEFTETKKMIFLK